VPAYSLSNPSTSVSLIRCAQDHDPEAWSKLSHLYGPLVYRWARTGGLNPEDAADVVQDVFLSIYRGVRSFSKEGGGTFRGWLRTVTRNAVFGLYRRCEMQPAAIGGSSADRRLQMLPEALQRESEPEEPDGENELAQRALLLIRETVDEPTWDAFQRTTLGNESAVDVARPLGK
jgi:RNA polymerase sigma-70 factor, ECF subfamily